MILLGGHPLIIYFLEMSGIIKKLPAKLAATPVPPVSTQTVQKKLPPAVKPNPGGAAVAKPPATTPMTTTTKTTSNKEMVIKKLPVSASKPAATLPTQTRASVPAATPTPIPVPKPVIAKELPAKVQKLPPPNQAKKPAATAPALQPKPVPVRVATPPPPSPPQAPSPIHPVEEDAEGLIGEYETESQQPESINVDTTNEEQDEPLAEGVVEDQLPEPTEEAEREEMSHMTQHTPPHKEEVQQEEQEAVVEEEEQQQQQQETLDVEDLINQIEEPLNPVENQETTIEEDEEQQQYQELPFDDTTEEQPPSEEVYEEVAEQDQPAAEMEEGEVGDQQVQEPEENQEPIVEDPDVVEIPTPKTNVKTNVSKKQIRNSSKKTTRSSSSSSLYHDDDTNNEPNLSFDVPKKLKKSKDVKKTIVGISISKLPEWVPDYILSRPLESKENIKTAQGFFRQLDDTEVAKLRTKIRLAKGDTILWQGEPMDVKKEGRPENVSIIRHTDPDTEEQSIQACYQNNSDGKYSIISKPKVKHFFPVIGMNALEKRKIKDIILEKKNRFSLEIRLTYSDDTEEVNDVELFFIPDDNYEAMCESKSKSKSSSGGKRTSTSSNDKKQKKTSKNTDGVEDEEDESKVIEDDSDEETLDKELIAGGEYDKNGNMKGFVVDDDDDDQNSGHISNKSIEGTQEQEGSDSEHDEHYDDAIGSDMEHLSTSDIVNWKRKPRRPTEPKNDALLEKYNSDEDDEEFDPKSHRNDDKIIPCDVPEGEFRMRPFPTKTVGTTPGPDEIDNPIALKIRDASKEYQRVIHGYKGPPPLVESGGSLDDTNVLENDSQSATMDVDQPVEVEPVALPTEPPAKAVKPPAGKPNGNANTDGKIKSTPSKPAASTPKPNPSVPSANTVKKPTAAAAVSTPKKKAAEPNIAVPAAPSTISKPKPTTVSKPAPPVSNVQTPTTQKPAAPKRKLEETVVNDPIPPANTTNTDSVDYKGVLEHMKTSIMYSAPKRIKLNPEAFGYIKPATDNQGRFDTDAPNVEAVWKNVTIGLKKISNGAVAVPANPLATPNPDNIQNMVAILYHYGSSILNTYMAVNSKLDAIDEDEVMEF